VNFGTATIRAPTRKTRAPKYDCGRHGRLTVKQIAITAKITPQAVTRRLRSGMRGEALCEPRNAFRTPKVRCLKPVIRTAVKLARLYPDRIPTLDEIQRAHPMGTRNAVSWRQAFAEMQKGAA
jgi:hypothetical protein